MNANITAKTDMRGKKNAPYENLANAIIIQAAEDYRTALKAMKESKGMKADCLDAERLKSDCERFFLSEWFKVLTSLDGKTLMRKLQEEFENDDRTI